MKLLFAFMFALLSVQLRVVNEVMCPVRVEVKQQNAIMHVVAVSSLSARSVKSARLQANHPITFRVLPGAGCSFSSYELPPLSLTGATTIEVRVRQYQHLSDARTLP